MADFDGSSPDGLLVAAAMDGKQEAFALLAERYARTLLRVAQSRLGRRELAEESVQETLLCAHRWLRTYDSRYSFRTWLWTILLNQCSRIGSREAKQAASLASGTGSGVADERAGTQPLEQLLAVETSERIQLLLKQLPAAQADALRLRFFGGLTFAEIGAAMNCSEAGAKHRVKTGLLKLAQWLRTKPLYAYRIERGGAEQRGGDE